MRQTEPTDKTVSLLIYESKKGTVTWVDISDLNLINAVKYCCKDFKFISPRIHTHPYMIALTVGDIDLLVNITCTEGTSHEVNPKLGSLQMGLNTV